MEEQKVPTDHGLRVGVKGGGCSGFSYILGFDVQKEKALVTFSLRRARADAWDFATALSASSNDDRRRLEAQRDAEVAALGARIARPGRPLRWLVGAAQRRERHDLNSVIAGLDRS